MLAELLLLLLLLAGLLLLLLWEVLAGLTRVGHIARLASCTIDLGRELIGKPAEPHASRHFLISCKLDSLLDWVQGLEIKFQCKIATAF